MTSGLLLLFFTFVTSLLNKLPSKFLWDSVGSFLSLLMGVMLMSTAPTSAQTTGQTTGQIRTDTTLETPSHVTVNGSRALIQGGVSEGRNLFHSFQDFHVNAGQHVYFDNPAGIENILSRVTGRDRTQILGTLGVEGPANLFLINPNGIFFGPNARLDLQGAFTASAANQLNFEDGSFFSAADNDSSQPSLLTVSAPLGLQHGRQAAFLGRQITIVDRGVMALVPNAGEITLSEGAVETFSGEKTLLLSANNDITLQNLADNSLDIQPGDGNILFTADNDENGTGAFTMADPADTIRTFGRDIAIAAAQLQLGNIITTATPNQDAGQSLSTARVVSQPSGPALTTISGQLSNPTDVDLYEIYISGSTPFSATTVATASGLSNPPNTQLFLFDAAGNGLYGNDNAPDCNCRQSTLRPEQSLAPGTYYLAVSSYATEPASNSGNIFPDSFERLEFNVLENPTGPGGSAPLNDWLSEPAIAIGGYDITLTGVTGQAAQITEMPLADSGDISLSATAGDIQVGELTTAATGNGGEISLSAQGGDLDLKGTLNALGVQGDGGEISLQATGDVEFRPGVSALSRGQLGGNLRIRSDRDIIVQGGLLLQQSTTTDSTELGGNFDIEGRSLLLQDGAQLISETLGTAPLRDSRVAVQEEVGLEGFSKLNLFSPFGLLATQVGSAATGEGGSLTLDVGTLRINDAAVVATRSFGRGNAGDLTIRGNEVVVSGAVEVNNPLLIALGESIFESELSTEAESEEDELLFQGGLSNSTPFLLSEANAGDLLIEVDRLRVENGGEVSAGTHSLGDGGNFTLIADEIIVTGQMLGESSELGTETVPEFVGARPPSGNAGRLVIVSDRISVTNGGKVGAESLALGGNAGNIEITAREIEVGGGFVYNGQVNTSAISSEVKNPASEGLQGDISRDFGGQGGNLRINAERLILREGGRISSGTAGNGDAGNVTVVVPDIDISGAFIPGIDLAADAAGSSPSARQPNQLTAQLASDVIGDPVSSGIFASSDTVGQSAGNVQVLARDRLSLSNRAAIEATTLGDRGNIDLTGGMVLLQNDSRITTNAAGGSTGGNISLAVNWLIGAPVLGNNDITANAEAGSGGQIRIRSRSPILGFQVGDGDTFRSSGLTPTATFTNDITAFSLFNPTVDTGEVSVEPPEIDPTEGLAELPVLADASDRIATGCAAQQGNRFTVSGQGGLPSDPRRGLRGSAISHDLRLNATPTPNNSSQASNLTSTDLNSTDVNPTDVNPTEPTQTAPIVEAQAFAQAADGTLSLIASVDHLYPSARFSPDHSPISCHRP